ncbi:hypothetical protein P691DRAFT_803760 [Macrolepiota fuliginosa MF-IS2]|uniref:Uncharacterized protein n=1 Tax=Macrolepiota fuliginosa MF-IS2 TaxID=1400762 RepID=A0A9P5XLG1_9AGAR|nr:hypothetical protein P691DRAFT_803760 [Macrolepiota fuliginosa MF-IS2]
MSNGLLLLTLAFDGDSAFEAVLTDIPLFCVGLMAMGVITFIFAMRRANSTALYLCTAALLLFVAAILDLGRLFIRGPTQAAPNVDLNVVSGFIVAREVALGLSYGFLFLFVWMAVARCPDSERRNLARQSSQESNQSQPHSASWARWGFIGTILKWFTLLLVILIPLLQIVWRIVDSQRRYGSIYIAQSTLEVVTSTIFILKVVLNVLVSPSISWWIPLQLYFGLVLGLIIAAAVGVGNLITFAFSEMVLGRFLRAISIYVLLLYNLINTFRRPTAERVPTNDREESIKPEKPKHLIIETADLNPGPIPQKTPSILTIERTIPTPMENPHPLLRVSASSRLSALVKRVEQNETLAELTRTMSKSSRKSPVTPTPPKKPRRPDLRFDIIMPPPHSAENSDSPEEPPTTGISLTYYTMNVEGRDVPNVPIIQDPSISPTKSSIYQSVRPGDVGGTSKTSFIIQPLSRAIPSVNSFDELMRQQNELDKSIANLRLLSVDTSSIKPPAKSAPTLPGSSLAEDSPASAKSRPQSTLRTDSLSQHSEFSLSIFPVPPSRPESVTAERRFSKPMALRKPPQIPVSSLNQAPSTSPIPESPSQTGGTARLTSAGTQYDVTSFIGDLTGNRYTATTGTLPLDALHNQVDNESGTKVDLSGDEATPPGNLANTNLQELGLKPMLLPSVASERKPIPPLRARPARDTTQPSPFVGPRDSSSVLKPFLLGTSITSIPVPLPSNTMVPLGPRRTSRATRIATHKSQISVPLLDTSDVSHVEAPEAFERPRPPPRLAGQPDRPKA